MSSVRSRLADLVFHQPRLLKYRLLSTCKRVEGRPRVVQPVLFVGGGRIVFGRNVQLGSNPAPFLHDGHSFVAALDANAIVQVSDDVSINNSVVLFSLGAGISIGARTVIGTRVEIYDSDFHGVQPDERASRYAACAPVVVGANVFIGSNVRILKGVSIGDNSVIGNGAVVTTSCPANTVLAGNPARAIRQL